MAMPPQGRQDQNQKSFVRTLFGISLTILLAVLFVVIIDQWILPALDLDPKVNSLIYTIALAFATVIGVFASGSRQYPRK